MHVMSAANPARRGATFRPSFLRAPYAPPDEAVAARLLAAAARPRRGRGAHRRPRQPADRGDPRPQCRRLRRGRGFPARLLALDQGRPGADGAGRGAAAGAGRRHRRPADRGQARRRRLVASRRRSERVSGVGFGLDAGHDGPRHSSGRDAGGHRRGPGQAARPAGGARRHPAGDAAAGLAFRAGADHRGGADARRRAPRVSLFVRHAGRGRAHRAPTPSAISSLMPTPSTAIGAIAPATRRCRSGPAFRSSCRRCIRATRRCRASAC